MARKAKRIGDVARAAGVGVETVRFYERQGLIEQPVKPERGWREYNKAQLRQLSYVRLARDLGLTLGDIKRVQAVVTGPRPEFCSAVRQTVATRLGEIEDDLARLARQVLQGLEAPQLHRARLVAQDARALVVPTPEPTSISLLGMGMVGLVWLRRRATA